MTRNNHMAADCCAEGCSICGAGPYEECRDTIDDGDDLEEMHWREPYDVGGVVDGFGNVVSDVELEMGPGW